MAQSSGGPLPDDDLEDDPVRVEYHAFVDSDAGRCGAILRHVAPGSLATRTVFRMGEDASVYLVDHVVDHDGDVREWTRFAYDAPSSDSRHAGTRHPDGSVHVDGTAAPQLADAVGGYSEHVQVGQLFREGTDAPSLLEFLQFDESEPEEGAQEAELRRYGTEATKLLDGSTVDAERVQLVLAGRASNTHWCVDGVVVKSDWCGAQSFLVDDLDVLCAGLDLEVAARIREFAALGAGQQDVLTTPASGR